MFSAHLTRFLYSKTNYSTFYGFYLIEESANLSTQSANEFVARSVPLIFHYPGQFGDTSSGSHLIEVTSGVSLPYVTPDQRETQISQHMYPIIQPQLYNNSAFMIPDVSQFKSNNLPQSATQAANAVFNFPQNPNLSSNLLPYSQIIEPHSISSITNPSTTTPSKNNTPSNPDAIPKSNTA